MKSTFTVSPLALTLFTVLTLAFQGSAELFLAMLIEKATSFPVRVPCTLPSGLLTQSTPLRTWIV